MADKPPNPDGWSEWSRHVLAELERLNNCYEKLARCQSQIKIEIATLKVKAGVWGLIGGAIPVAITLAVLALKILGGSW